jgi:hypothetical protein
VGLIDLSARRRVFKCRSRTVSRLLLVGLVACGLGACEIKTDVAAESKADMAARQDRERALEAERANAGAKAEDDLSQRQASEWAAENAAARKVGVSRICRAAIASLMAQNPNIIRATPAEDATTDKGMTVRTRYVRRSDGTVWRNECSVAGNRVIWAAIDDDGSVGRKRTEDKIYFSAKGATINIIQELDGVRISSETYTVR